MEKIINNIIKSIREANIDLFIENISKISLKEKYFYRYGFEDGYPDMDIMEFLAYQKYNRSEKSEYVYSKQYDGNIECDIEMMTIVLNLGYDINNSDALIIAITHNSTKVCKFLIENGANNIREGRGFVSDMPLHHAARSCNRELMDILYKIGYKDDKKFGGYSAEEEYILEMKRKTNSLNVYEMLSKHYRLMFENSEYRETIEMGNSRGSTEKVVSILEMNNIDTNILNLPLPHRYLLHAQPQQY
jgi:hypothetical protein